MFEALKQTLLAFFLLLLLSLFLESLHLYVLADAFSGLEIEQALVLDPSE